MNGIKMSDCKFYVNEEARTVVCIIPNTERILENFIRQHFQFSDFDFSAYWGRSFMRSLKMPYSFVGKAVCSPDDTWNEELGRIIAFSRAKDKCYISFFKRANVFVQTLDRRLGDVITILNDFGTKLSQKKEKMEAMIEEKMPKE